MNRERVDLLHGCPDCDSADFHPGPRGCASINVKCAKCGATFNFCGPLSHRIEEVPGVYSPVVQPLKEMSYVSASREVQEEAARWYVEIESGGLTVEQVHALKEWLEQDASHGATLDAITRANEWAAMLLRGGTVPGGRQ